METSQIAFAVGILVFLATLLTLYAIFKKPLNLKERLNREEVKDTNEGAVNAIQKQLERVLRPMGEWLPRSPAEMSRHSSQWRSPRDRSARVGRLRHHRSSLPQAHVVWSAFNHHRRRGSG